MRGLHVSCQPPHTMPRCLSFPGTPRGGLHLPSPPKIPPTQRPRFASKVKGTSFAQAPNLQRAFLEFPAPPPPKILQIPPCIRAIAWSHTHHLRFLGGPPILAGGLSPGL